VLRIVGEIHRRHSAAANFSNDAIASAENARDRSLGLGEQRRICERRRLGEQSRPEIARSE
jgi:hypothetical protein